MNRFFFEVGKILTVYGLEKFAEVSDVLEAQVIGDLFHTGVAVSRAAFGFEYDPLADVIACGIAGYLFDDLVEVVGRHRQFAGVVLHQFPVHVFLFDQFDEVLYESDVLGLHGHLHRAVELSGQVNEEDAGVPPDDLGAQEVNIVQLFVESPDDLFDLVGCLGCYSDPRGMHQQVEETGAVKQIEIVVAGVEEVFRKGDEKSFCFVLDLQLVQLAGDNAIEGIVGHLISLQIDIQAAVSIPDPDDLNMLVAVRHLVLPGPVLT